MDFKLFGKTSLVVNTKFKLFLASQLGKSMSKRRPAAERILTPDRKMRPLKWRRKIRGPEAPMGPVRVVVDHPGIFSPPTSVILFGNLLLGSSSLGS